MKRYVFLFLALLIALAQAAPGVKVDQELILPEDPLPFGKPAQLVITLEWPVSSSLEPPAPKELAVPQATTIDSYMVDKGSDGTYRKVSYHLVFTRFEPGPFEVGPVEIATTAGPVKSETLRMEFAGSQPNDQDKPGEIRGAKPVVEISTFDFWKKVASYAGATLLLVIALWALLHYSGLLDKLRSPKARALKRLRKLGKSEAEGEDVILECVDILRCYLNQAYGMATREATSKEIINLLILDNRASHLKDVSEELLVRGDRVKFAAASLSTPEAFDLQQKLTSTLSEEKKVPQK